MSESITKLGFSIPVYNRPDLLDIALGSIVKEASIFNAPIYIPDNSCSDINKSIIEKWKCIYNNIIHELNSENIGIDGNVQKAIVNCPSKYVLVIGDDDIIFEGLYTKVLEKINKYKPLHIFINYKYLDNNYNAISNKSLFEETTEEMVFKSFLIKNGWCMGFIGCNIFNRDLYSRCSESEIGSYFNHVAKILSYINPSDRVICIRDILVGNRADDETTATWGGNRIVVLFGLERVFKKYLNGKLSEFEINLTVNKTRKILGYDQLFRLIYWGSLSINPNEYWDTVYSLLPQKKILFLKKYHYNFYYLIQKIFPLARKIKRKIKLI